MDTLRTSGKPKPYDRQQEKLPFLPEHDRHEVVVKIDGNSQNPVETNTSATASSPNSRVWREGSYDFSQEGGAGNGGFTFGSGPTEDPPSRLISSFLRKRDATGGTMSPAVDLEMDFLNNGSSLGSESKEHRISFQDALEQSFPRESNDSSSSSSDEKKINRNRHSAGGDGEVIRCTSNSLIGRSSSLLGPKTRSRLMDPSPALSPSPVKKPDPDRRSGRPPMPRSGQLKSGSTGGKSGPVDEDDDDLFMDSDIPDELKKTKFNTWSVLQSLSLILIIAALVCSRVIPWLTRQTVWSLHLWKWDVLVLTLICGRLVSGWFVRVAVFLIERNFLLRKRVLYFVYGVKSAVQNCLWLGLVLLSWHYLFDRKTSHSPVLPYVSKILLCLLVATILRLIKTLLLKVLAASFHVSTYFDRIQEALFNQYVVETLSGPHVYEDNQTMVEVQRLQKAGATMPSDLQATALPAKNSGQIGKGIRLSRALSGNKREEGITIDQLHKMNQRNISAWNMKRLIRIVRYGALTTLDERIPLISAETEEDSSTHILSEREAKIAARKIFTNVAKPGAKYIYLHDLLRFMRQEEATNTMNLFEGAHEHKRISKRALKNWAVNAFRERKALALTLNDTKTAVNKLHQIANVVVGVIVFAIWLLILGIATTHFFVFLSSQLLLAVFIFGNTLKTLFEALIFLFVMHPFDVGDRCEIEGVQVVVEEMNIMSTVFLRYDNLKIYYPNSILATKPISNYYRSPDMGDSIDFAIHVATPLEKIAKMKERIIHFMENKKEHWYPGPMVVLRDVEDSNKLTVSIWMRQRINYQDMGMRFERRELVVQEMIRVLREFDIEYRMIPVDVNVRNLPPVNSARLPSTWSSVN
ncbi:mechanosensitive ion channel protein 6-like protein [Carex littledalei]|uniref:Mechanosensitive ion channel protein n=1 Tax=Carex littledalei TaxID=544730 RepID=A0A833RX14_9POAL|nr:mechanosensitive ion channel protein 6-like protein [Carex littledalei]